MSVLMAGKDVSAHKVMKDTMIRFHSVFCKSKAAN